MISTTAQHDTRAEHLAGSADDLAASFGTARPTLLAVWAHPDDESYLGGGLMAAVAERGGRVVNVSATLGEHGTDDPSTFPPDRLATIRRAELDQATSALGVDESMHLGFVDGACERTSDELGAARVATVLDAVRPDVVLTFGSDGVTGHADHRAVGRWTARAVGDSGGRIPLVTTAAAEAWPSDLIERMHRVDAFYPGYPDVPMGGVRWDVRLTGAVFGRKLAALGAHASQIGPLRDELGTAGYRRLAAHEAYRPANEIALRHMTVGHRRSDTAA